MPALSIDDEEILRESRSGQGCQEERLNNGTEDGDAILAGAKAKEEKSRWVIADSSDDDE
jgi:hypothetical protein